MAVSLTKGGNVSLSKHSQFKKILIGLGWDARSTMGKISTWMLACSS